MEEKVQIQIETTKQELINKAYHLLTAISELADNINWLADNINCINFSKDPADLEADVLKYAYSIKALSETAQTLLFHVNGEL